MNKLYAWDRAKNKKILVGQIIGNGVIIEKDPKKHLMRRVDGYGIQLEAMREMQEQGIETIYIHEPDLKWKVSLSDWKVFGKLMDFGHGKQWFLSRKYMKQYKPDVNIIK